MVEFRIVAMWVSMDFDPRPVTIEEKKKQA
jgi:hypothetical protein